MTAERHGEGAGAPDRSAPVTGRVRGAARRGAELEAPYGITLRQAVDRYVRHRVLENHHPRSYWALTTWAVPALGDRTLPSLTADDIEDALDDYAKRRKLSPASRLNFRGFDQHGNRDPRCLIRRTLTAPEVSGGAIEGGGERCLARWVWP